MFNLSELFPAPSLYCNDWQFSISELSGTYHFHSLLLLSEVSELNTPSSAHAAKGGWLDVPVFNRVGKQTDACIQVLLDTGPAGTEVVDSHAADFVAMEENHLNRRERI